MMFHDCTYAESNRPRSGGRGAPQGRCGTTGFLSFESQSEITRGGKTPVSRRNRDSALRFRQDQPFTSKEVSKQKGMPGPTFCWPGKLGHLTAT